MVFSVCTAPSLFTSYTEVYFNIINSVEHTHSQRRYSYPAWNSFPRSRYVQQLTYPALIVVVVVVVVVVVFTLNRSFYPTTSAVHPVFVLILHPREIQILRSVSERQKR